MTFVIEDGVQTCIVQVKEEVMNRTPEETADQLGRILNNFEVKEDPVERISGTEPSSVILIQKVSLKSLKGITKNCLNKLKPKGMM